jgi:hypothetical protein
MRKSFEVILMLLASLMLVCPDAFGRHFIAKNDGGEDDWK